MIYISHVGSYVKTKPQPLLERDQRIQLRKSSSLVASTAIPSSADRRTIRGAFVWIPQRRSPFELRWRFDRITFHNRYNLLNTELMSVFAWILFQGFGNCFKILISAVRFCAETQQWYQSYLRKPLIQITCFNCIRYI